ncbi:MAG: 1,4-alpha-glucan branching protein GlgB [Chlamydiales bacterium]|nr:1,4-alpha-glucan branching protein GlgB [Chlamydiia bacterium]MCP5506824.1 1,4-alpha-glucan branching protein GlgB [Chlamydiales bacterium]
MKISGTVPASLLTDEDIRLFKEGRHHTLYEKLGSHLMVHNDVAGALFSVWAPNAREVSVIGSFNGWNTDEHHLYPRWDSSGIWEAFIPGVKQGDIYKYHLVSNVDGSVLDKADPYAFHCETPPKTASVVWDLDYTWEEKSPLPGINDMDAPMSIYELHIGSWKRSVENNGSSLSYRQLADELPGYVKEMGFTHVEFLPVMEHPFYGSWGYQTLGYFAPTSRYGTPQDFMHLIDALHREGIGVILDWVPSHFPDDPHGLGNFDGTCLYDHADPKKGYHPDWKSRIFNYGRPEVRAFLLSSAHYWCARYHVDGIRVDAVASMLYLDYSRKDGEWIPNDYGGNENLEALEFLRWLNEMLYGCFPHIQTIAEESTAWPMVSRPTYLGGLGFGYKWNMGWMHDTLEYFKKDPVFRKFHHNELLFSLHYAFSENYVLPLSHDEVVYGKRSLLSKMPGDEWQKRANFRTLLGYLFAHPGKKLLFMGGEFGQWEEWEHETSIDWHLLDENSHQGIQRWVRDLNELYRREKPLHELDLSPEGFEWVDVSDWESSIIALLRKGKKAGDELLVVCNLTPIIRENYKIGVNRQGSWKEVLNSDSTYYGGSDVGNFGEIKTTPFHCHGREYTLNMTLPPLGILFLKPVR